MPAHWNTEAATVGSDSALEDFMMSVRFLLPALLLSAVGTVSARDLGSPMPDGDALPLSAAIADERSFGEPARKFSGRVTEVCRKKGCWLMLEDDGDAARVMIHDHGFVVPADARGRAVVYGVLSSKDLSPDAAAHLAEDAGRSESAPGREFRINAYSVSLLGD